MTNRLATFLPWVLSGIGIPVIAFFSPSWITNLAALVACYAFAGLGLMILWRIGLVSFGHALYLGAGAYSVVLANQFLGITDVLLVCALAILVCTVCSGVLGFLTRKFRGIFFAMINLALSMMLYGAVVKSRSLGSTDGFSVLKPTLLGFSLATGDPDLNRQILFIIDGVLLLGALIGLTLYMRTAFGTLSTAVRDNEVRLEYLGYSAARVIHVNYILSASLTGLGGSLLALSVGQVDPDSMLNWTVSGELLFLTILGGLGSVWAPVIGASIFEILKLYTSELFGGHWSTVLGVALIVLTLFFPTGVWPVAHSTFSRLFRGPTQ